MRTDWKLSALNAGTAKKLLNRLPIGPSGTPDEVILEIDLDRGVLSAPPGDPLSALRSINAASMRAIREGLREAASDDAVKGLIVHVGTCPITPTQCDELGDLVEQFGAAKPTLAYTESFGELGNALLAYRLATCAQQVWLQPTGGVGIFGVHLEILLLRGGLDKLGIEPQFGQRKEFKTAADQFSAREVTDANREMMSRIAESITADSVAAIARRRGLSPEQVWDAVNHAPLTASEALERNLVDHLGYRDEVYAAAREAWNVPVAKGADAADSLRFVHRYGKGSKPLRDVNDVVAKVFPNRSSQPAIAVVAVHGGIVSGRTTPNPGAMSASSGSDEVCEQLRAAGRDEHVKAVVLRVDSPGGSAVASDQIWRAVHQLREGGTPVVASMGDVAASGGYYVSMGANEIVANPTTLTGSIGVFAGKAITQGLFDKLGLVREAVESGARAGMMRGDDAFTDDEWAVLNRWLDDIYADFTGKAAADRGMSIDELEPLARGRVWTGSDAAERHLVDHIGGLDTAIERACALAEVDRDKTTLRSMPAVPFVARFRPAANSESVSQAAVARSASGLGALLTQLRSAGGVPLDVVDAATAALAPVGVLTCPWVFGIR